MSDNNINVTAPLHAATKKGKLGAAKEIFLEGDTQTVENEIQDINSRHNDLSSEHESLSSTVSEHAKQIDSNQSQITANKSAQDEKNKSLDANMAKLNTRDDQITELVKGVTATGGASVATAVTYDNTSSNLDAATVQGAVDELQGSKIDKTSILQESGDAEDKVMSQKAVSAKLRDLSTESKTAALYPKALPYTDGYYVRSDGELHQQEGSKCYGYFKVAEGETIVYTGNYGGSCLGIAYYDENYNFLSGESKENLGTPATYEFIVPANAVYAIASTFNITLSVLIKGGVIDTINSLEKNKLNKEEFNKTVVDIKRNEDVLNKTAALYPKALPYTDGYYVRSDGELHQQEGSKCYGYFKVAEGETIVYTGNYGGSCLGIAYYDENYNFLSGESKENLGTPATYEFIVPANAVYAIASTFNITLSVLIKGGVIDTINSLEKNKLNKEEFNKTVVDIKRNEDVLNKTAALYPKALPYTDGYYVRSDGELHQQEGSKCYGYFKVAEGETIVYTGNYGGSCLGIAYYDENYNFLSGESKENLGTPATYEFIVPANAVYAIASTFNITLSVLIKGGVIDTINSLEKNKLNKEEFNKTVVDIKRNEDVLNKTAALYPKALPYTDGYYVRSDGELHQQEGSKCYGYFKVAEGETIVYTGNYGGSCLGIAYYDENYNFLSGESKENLGTPATYEFIVPANAVYAIASTFNITLSVLIKGGVIDTINSLEKNKLNKEEFNKTVVDIKRNEDVLNKTAALYPKALPYTDGYYVRSDGELHQHEGSKYYGHFKVTEGETIVYTGNYGGSCLAIAYYDENYKFLSGESKENLGGTITYFTVPAGAVYAIASTFKGNFDIRLSNSLIQDIVALQNSKEELNSDIKQSLSKKFRNFDDHFAYMREVDRAVLFAAFVPKKGYENDDMKIIALSAYYNKLADDEIPTRFDLWVYNGTKQKDFYQYINKDVNNQNRYQKIYYTGEMGTLYALIDTDVLRAHKNTDNKYTYLIWGTASKFIINSYSSIDENPFLNHMLWENNKKNSHIYTIAWFGTSIPASSYPTVVGKLLGCTVYNEAVGESLVRLGWGKNCIASGDTIDKWGCSGKDTSKFNPISNTLAALAKSLSASIEEKQYLIDNLDHFKEITNYTGDFPYTNEQIKGFSYENKLLKYIDSSRQDYIKTDLIVFDHGHNDLNPDGDPVWSSYDIANRTKDNYWGAMNFLMDIIRKYNPHQNVCQISHYQGDVDYSAYYYKTQKKFADHWGIPFIELYKVTQLSTTEKVRTNGWWGYTDGLWHESGFVFNKNSDGTFTTNQSCIIQYDFGISNGSYDTTTQTFTSKIMEIPTATVSRDIKKEGGKTTCLLSPRECFMKDRLHPLSDKSKVAVNRIAEWLASMLNSIYKIQ